MTALSLMRRYSKDRKQRLEIDEESLAKLNLLKYFYDHKVGAPSEFQVYG